MNSLIFERTVAEIVERVLEQKKDQLALAARSALISVGNHTINIHPDARPENALLNAHSGNITIGKDTFFGDSVAVLAGSHNPNLTGNARMAIVPDGCDIVIGEGVWIGSRALIIGPCVIGDYAVIAAGSVVKTDIPSGSLYAGVPAKFIRNLELNLDK